MKLNIDIESMGGIERSRIDFIIENGLCCFKGFDLLTNDQLELFELELTKIVQKIYQHRKDCCS